MKLIPVCDAEYEVFHKLLNAYYRDGEDEQTPQAQLDAFICHLYDLCVSGGISGCIAMDHGPVGFVLWMIDSKESPFSQKPGYGTILEIGVFPDSRNVGLGRKLAEYAESKMQAQAYYVCAYGPAETFWKKCGYTDSGELAENGLKLMIKGELSGRETS